MTFNAIRLGVRCLALLILAACVSSISLNAQSTTQGSIAGSVLDSSDAAVPGAAIHIQNVATGFAVNLVTDGSGYFKAPLLEPGKYTVAVSSPNFANYRADDVIVFVGQVTSLEPRLAVASSTAQVIVTEQAPVMNLESPDFSETLNAVAMQNVPINNRRWSALALSTPGVVSDTSGFGLVSIRGISTVLNNVEIDGADDNDDFYSEERGRTREAYSTSASAVREFAVNTGVYSAEYGRAAGGVITSVTNSGTNQLHGHAYFYDRESNWNAFNDYAKESFLNTTTNQYVSQHIKPEDLRKIYGFTVGGPLIKNKLFWIYTYDQHTHVFPGAAIPTNPAAFYALPTPSASLPSGVTAVNCNLATGYWSASSSADTNSAIDADACTLAARQHFTSGATSAYDQGVTAYDTWIANMNGDLGLVPRTGFQEINTPKLDWQVNDKEHVSVLFHRLRWDAPGDVQTSSTSDYARDTWGNDFVKLDYGVAKLTSLITSSMSNELLYQYSRELLAETQQPLTSYTKNYLEGNGVTANHSIPEVAMDTSEGMNLGSPYYSYRLANPAENKWQIGDILYWNKGNHSFKFGVDELHNYDFNNTYGGDGNGYYVYSYVGNYINDQLNANTGTSGGCTSSVPRNGTSTASGVGTYPCYSTFTQTFGPHVYGISTMDSGVFGQDNWKITPRLTLELGLRWDYEALPPADPNLTKAVGTFTPYPQLTNNPSDKMNFGPRFGFSYNLDGAGNTVLRGGYGIYYGRIINGELLSIRFGTGSPNGQYNTVYKVTTTGYPTLPNIVTSTGAAATPSSTFLSANLRDPEVQEYDLELQQAFGHGTFFALSYLGGLGRELPNFLDLNLNPTQTTINVTVSDASGKGPLGPTGTVLQVPQFTGYGNTAIFGSVATNFQVITEMVSNINSNYNALVAEIQNHSLKRVQFDANYTWSHSLDFGQNANTTSTAVNDWYDPYKNPRINYGDSPWNTPNRFVAYALYSFPNMRSSSPLKWVANDWSLDDSFQMSNGLPYTVGVSGFFSAGILSDWNGGSGSTLIPQIGTETGRYPRHIVDDVRLQKAIAFGDGRSLELMGNFFNIANHQNIDGLGTTAYKLSGTTATFQGQGTSNPSNNTYLIPTSSNNSGFTFTPRQIEIAARLNF